MAEIQLEQQQAADLLDVSLPFLNRLLEQGQIRSTGFGTHLYLVAGDVMAYKNQIDTERRSVLDELAGQAQEIGMGYE